MRQFVFLDRFTVLFSFGIPSYGAAFKRFRMVSNIFPVIFLLFFSNSCQSGRELHNTIPGQLSAQWMDFKLPYDLSSPAANWPLPAELLEVSGLSLSGDGNFLLAVQDETRRGFYSDVSKATTDHLEFVKV